MALHSGMVVEEEAMNGSRGGVTGDGQGQPLATSSAGLMKWESSQQPGTRSTGIGVGGGGGGGGGVTAVATPGLKGDGSTRL